MKCPKCSYLGFETGDRCKNCGYDFSLMDEPERPIDFDLDVDLTLRSSDDTLPASVQWDDNFGSLSAETSADVAALAESPASLDIADPLPEPMPEPARETPPRLDRKLPLFGAGSVPADSDEPLIKLPAAPRAPLAVRRTPETPRLRAVPRSVPRPSRPIDASPPLAFVEDAPHVAHIRHAEVSGAGARLVAAALDHLLLGAIDLAVVYFTLRMAGLTLADLSVLPIAPLVVFLLLVKLAYFSAFTAVGGQTIGKMATRIRVVTAEDQDVDGSLAVKRTLAGAISAATLGLGFVPALIGPERRALHDRLTHTRVVALPS